MKRVSWCDVLSFLGLVAMTMLMVWMVVRDIDKNVERECGYSRHENAPAYCESWWDDKNVPMKSTQN